MNSKYDQLRKWVSVQYRQFQIFMSNNLKDLDITVAEYYFLIAMYDNCNVSQDDLCKMLIIDKAATARSIKSLEEKEYIIRKKDEKDKRTNRIELTNKAIQLKERLLSYNSEWGNIVSENIDEETLNLVVSTIEKMSKNAINKNNPNCKEN